MVDISAPGVFALRADAAGVSALGVPASASVATGAARVLDSPAAVAGLAEPFRGVTVSASRACGAAASATSARAADDRRAGCRAASVGEAGGSEGKEDLSRLGRRDAPAPADEALPAAWNDTLGDARACVSMPLLM
jgi:hypothetical protein